MRRSPGNKLQRLGVIHPGLCEKVHSMFAEAWPTQAVVHEIASCYGERIGLRTVETYKHDHWRALRTTVQEASEALGEQGSGDGGEGLGKEPRTAILSPDARIEA